MLICKSECQDVVSVKDMTICQEKLNTEIRNRQTDTNMLGEPSIHLPMDLEVKELTLLCWVSVLF